MMSKSIHFVTFNPETLYELKGECGTTLEMLGGFFWRNARGEVNYDRTGRRFNGLADILKWRRDHAPYTQLWALNGKCKKLVVDFNQQNVQIDMRTMT